MVVGDGVLRRKMGHEDESLMMELVALLRRDTRELAPTSSHHVKAQQKVATCHPGSELSSEPDQAGA